MKKEENRANTMGSLIKTAREEASLSQADFAEKLGFQSATAVSLIEKGDRGVSSAMLQQMAHILHKDIRYFLGLREDALDVKVALRADKDISPEDKDAILHFIELAKRKKDAK